jgi:dolichyl-phosphate beta-glucosyltransferase
MRDKRVTPIIIDGLHSLSIVVPAYNEDARLPATLQAIEQFLAERSWTFVEVMIVDDGSTDRTAEVVSAYAGPHPVFRLLRNPGNRGKGYSVRHGMLEAQGEWVLFTDADLSAPIGEFDKLAEAVEMFGADIAIGSRGLDSSLIKVHQSLFREYSGRTFNLVMQLVTGLHFWDTQCGFKLFRREAAREIFRRQTIERFGFDAEVLYLAKKLGCKTVEVPVLWAHAEGTKVSMLRDGMNMFLDLFRVRMNDLHGKYR